MSFPGTLPELRRGKPDRESRLSQQLISARRRLEFYITHCSVLHFNVLVIWATTPLLLYRDLSVGLPCAFHQAAERAGNK